MSTHVANRRPAGSPAGGQFAPASHAESGLDLPDPWADAPAVAAEPSLPDFATCDRISTERWEAVALATQEANEATMGSLAGLIAEHHPEAAGVHLETTYDDDGATYVYAADLKRADGSLIAVSDDLADEPAFHGADLNLHDLRRRFLDEGHPRSRHQPSEPVIGTWHGEEDGASIVVAKLAAVSPLTAKPEAERRTVATAAWDRNAALYRSANVASMAAAATWFGEKYPHAAEAEIDVLYDNDGTHCFTNPSMFEADGTEIGFEGDLEAEDEAVQRFTDIELDDLIGRFLTQDRGPQRTQQEPTEESVGTWDCDTTVRVDIAKLRAAAAARFNA